MVFSHTFSQVRSGTWMMTGNGVMHNGTTTVDDYGQNLDKLKVFTKSIYRDDANTEERTNKRNSQVGDRVAVVRKESGVLHFFVNSEDQVGFNLIRNAGSHSPSSDPECDPAFWVQQ